MAQDLRCRPSSLMGVTDSLYAFYLDRSIWTFASTINAEMDAAVTRLPKSAKESAHRRARQRVLDQYLGYEEQSATRFRAPSTVQ